MENITINPVKVSEELAFLVLLDEINPYSASDLWDKEKDECRDEYKERYQWLYEYYLEFLTERQIK